MNFVQILNLFKIWNLKLFKSKKNRIEKVKQQIRKKLLWGRSDKSAPAGGAMIARALKRSIGAPEPFGRPPTRTYNIGPSIG
jgi:hypothetical protein